MKLIDFMNNMSPDMDIRIFGEDGEMLFMGCAGQIQNSIMFNEWTVIEHTYHTCCMIVWIA